MADSFNPQHGKRLEDPARLEALPQSSVVDLLRLEGDETIVDYGAGTGIYTVAVAAAVPSGKVFAVEALPQLAELLRQKITPEAAALGIENEERDYYASEFTKIAEWASAFSEALRDRRLKAL